MQNKRIKLIILVGLIALLLFGLWNVTWLVMTNNRYSDFLKAVPKSEFGNHILKKDTYVYNVKRPDYLSFTGNLGINNPEKGTALIIWPKITGGYEYGIRIQAQGKAYEFYLNEQLEPINQSNQQTLKLVQKFKPEITLLLGLANEMWNLDS